ncbi:1325_t:CDS:10 [Ambispora leptoticha]|uniref:1325_t:CDS:1 n=1 Tax=Ambispora leptoticha TaxID=144679 RepID=A0A9N8V9F4_9GLOM|nr:1325_t:CDS:10 [Ambispora leptoticha]
MSEKGSHPDNVIPLQPPSRRRTPSATSKPIESVFSQQEIDSNRSEKLDSTKHPSNQEMTLNPDPKKLLRSPSFERSLDRERIGHAGKSFVYLMNEEGGKESVASLLASVKDEDALLLAKKQANQKSRAHSPVNLEPVKKEAHDDGHRASNSVPSDRTISASRACKQYFENKYRIISEMLEENINYNPLQIIRNRQEENSKDTIGADSESNQSIRPRNTGGISSKNFWDVTNEELIAYKNTVGNKKSHMHKATIEENLTEHFNTKIFEYRTSSSVESLPIIRVESSPASFTGKTQSRRLSHPSMNNLFTKDSLTIYQGTDSVNNSNSKGDTVYFSDETSSNTKKSSRDQKHNRSFSLNGVEKDGTHHRKAIRWSSLFRRKPKSHKHIPEVITHEEETNKVEEKIKNDETLQVNPNFEKRNSIYSINSSESLISLSESSDNATWQRSSLEQSGTSVDKPPVPLVTPDADSGTISDEGNRSIRSMMASSDVGEIEKEQHPENADIDMTKDLLGVGQNVKDDDQYSSASSSELSSARHSIADVNSSDDYKSHQVELEKIIDRYNKCIQETSAFLESNQANLADRYQAIDSDLFFFHDIEDMDFVQSPKPISEDSSRDNYKTNESSSVRTEMQIEIGLKMFETDLQEFEAMRKNLDEQHASLSEEMDSTLEKIGDMSLVVNNNYFHELKLLEDDMQLLTERDKSLWLDIFYSLLSYVIAGVTNETDSSSLILKDSLLNSNIRKKLEGLVLRHSVLLKEFDEKDSTIKDPEAFASLSKELSNIGNIIEPYKELKTVQNELLEISQMIADSKNDQDLKAMAQEEYKRTKDQIRELERTIVTELLPKDSADEGSAILEIRAGAGGDEAAIFAGEILRMYEKYAFLQKWRFEILSISEDSIGAMKEATASITGMAVFGNMKYESGVHRVQRVPATENQGRVHTSTITVAILPQATDVEVDIKDSDLKIDYYRASGKGGQHVNKTESAARVTHLPTGLVVAIQDERSQPKNKAKALRILRAKLYEMERNKLHNERIDSRRQQIGTAERSEKIRTYNYPQNRVTDHRLNLTLYELENVMNGISLQTIIDNCKLHFQTEALANFL